MVKPQQLFFFFFKPNSEAAPIITSTVWDTLIWRHLGRNKPNEVELCSWSFSEIWPVCLVLLKLQTDEHIETKTVSLSYSARR